MRAMPQEPVRRQRRREDWQAQAQARPILSPTWETAVQAFIRAARARNCSASTLENYKNYLLGPRSRQFLTDYQIRSVSDVTVDVLRNFQYELLEAGLAPGTADTFRRVMRNFLGFCRREGWGVPEEALTTPAPRQPQVEPETFSEEEERRLIEAARTDRDKFLIEFMMRTGLRLTEVTNVTLDDIIDGPEGAYVRVRQGKGAKDRIVPLDTKTARFSRRLGSYIRNTRPSTTRSRHLFLSSRTSPKTKDHEPLKPSAIKTLMKRLTEETGIHAHPHKFRHTFATRALSAGVDVMALQRALGHTTLAMVSRYVHYQRDDLLEAWRRRRD
jgi:site-specific recombinase XerD